MENLSPGNFKNSVCYNHCTESVILQFSNDNYSNFYSLEDLLVCLSMRILVVDHDNCIFVKTCSFFAKKGYNNVLMCSESKSIIEIFFQVEF